MKRMWLSIFIAVVGVGLLVAGCQATRAGYESAPYKVVRSDGKFELRDYPALTVVETPMANPNGSDGGFMRLFRFITGANEGKQKIAMTTPVFMSGSATHLTMAFVAETAGGLLRGHASNFRNILEVPLDRMLEPGLRDILSHGEAVLSMKFSDEVSTEIIELCDRMPYFLHLLAKHAAKAAMELGAPTVELDDLSRGSVEAAEAADQQLRTSYDHAVMADGEVGFIRKMSLWGAGFFGRNTEKTDTSVYQRIIWAMANLPKKGNNVAEITLQVNKIRIEMSDSDLTEKAVRIALKRLTSTKKGQILAQPFPDRYSFSSPLMKGFVRLVRYQK